MVQQVANPDLCVPEAQQLANSDLGALGDRGHIVQVQRDSRRG